MPIDGKALRRSHDKTLGCKAIHMVSAWASESRVVLGQVKAEQQRGHKTTTAERFYISSLSGDAEKMLEVVRGHWPLVQNHSQQPVCQLQHHRAKRG